MTFDITILISTFVINFILGVFILFRRWRNLTNRVFGILVILTSIWVLSIAFFWLAPSTEVALVWSKIAYFTASYLPVFLLYFSILFPKKIFELDKVKSFIILLPGIAFSLLTLINLVVKDIVLDMGILTVRGGIFYTYFIIYSISYLVITFILLIKKYRKYTGIPKVQLKLVFVGIFVTVIVSIITNLILPAFNISDLGSLGPFSTIIMVLFMFYAISRYRLMDVRLVIVRSLAFGSIVLVITGLFAALSATIGRFLEEFWGTKSDLIVGLVVAFLIAIAYSPLKHLIERATNKFLFKKTYDPDMLISQMSDISTSILDITNMLTLMSKALEVTMHPEKIAFALLDKGGKLQISYEQGFGKQIFEFTKGKEKILPTYFKDSREVYAIEELKTAYEQGEYQPKNIKLMYALYEMDVALIVPLFTKDKLIGLIAIGNKKSGDLYNKQDLHVLDIISGQAAVGIENALLYLEQKQFGIKLEKTVKDRTAELRVANKKLTHLDEAKSEFISIASHQLRTPLTVIKGYISMILEGSFGKTTKVVKDNLTKVYASNERLIGLVEDLLNISRIESGRQEYNFQPVNIVEQAQVVYEELVQKAKDKGLKLIFEKPKKALPKIVADADKLHEVMINFVDNSTKYTKKGQSVKAIYLRNFLVLKVVS